MPPSRRGFLKSGLMALAAAGVVSSTRGLAFAQTGSGDPSQDFQVPYEAQTDPVYFFKRTTFEPYVGTVFRGRGVGRTTVELKLLSVTDYSTARTTRLTTEAPRRTESFSLVFAASAPLTDLTTVHTLSHDALGKFNLFLTHSEKDGRIFYTAVINHLA